MARLRGCTQASGASRISGGPGRLCQALGITRELHNGVDVTRPGSTLHVVDDGYHVSRVVVTPRIGIQKGGDFPLRFLITSDHRAADVQAENNEPEPPEMYQWLRCDSGPFRMQIRRDDVIILNRKMNRPALFEERHVADGCVSMADDVRYGLAQGQAKHVDLAR